MTSPDYRPNRRHFIQSVTAGFAGLSWSIRELAGGRQWTAIQKLIDGYVADKKMAGAGVAISYGGAPVTYLAAGTIAFDSQKRFDESSICRIHSLTKPVTGIAAMLLVEDGKLSLDQPVADVLPEFRALRVAIDVERSLDSRPATKTMTMRHLLTHTSGFASWTPLSSGPALLHVAYRERGITPGNFGERLNRQGYGPQATSLVDMVRRLAELPLAYEPGTVSNYSIGTDVIALVIERASGMPYERFLRDRLFTPLDMPSTGFQVRREDAGRLTTLYQFAPTGLTPTDAAATSAFLEPPRLIAGGGGLVVDASRLRTLRRHAARRWRARRDPRDEGRNRARRAVEPPAGRRAQSDDWSGCGRAAGAARRQSRHAARYLDGQRRQRRPLVDGHLTPRQRRLSDAGDRHRAGGVYRAGGTVGRTRSGPQAGVSLLRRGTFK